MTSRHRINWLNRDILLLSILLIFGGAYLGVVVAMMTADASIAIGKIEKVRETFASPDIHHAIYLSLITSVISTAFSLIIGLPIAYVLSRSQFWAKPLLEFVSDIPIVLPPLVVGLSLFVLLRQTPLRVLDDQLGISFAVPGIILAQTMISTALVVHAVRASLDSISPRAEQVALTLGCKPWQAIWYVLIPNAWPGILTATSLAWARAFGEFGPILVLAGSTRMKTMVLPTSIYLEFSSGNFEGALGISLLMVLIALIVLVSVRLLVRSGTK